MSDLKYEHGLGLITGGFQSLEFYFSIFAWGLMGKDRKIGQTVTAQISFSKLLLLVSSLFRSRTCDEILLKDLDEIISRASKIEQIRNRVVHSVYLQMSEDIEAELLRMKIVSKLNKGVVQQWETMPVEELMDIAVELAHVKQLLVSFIGRVREPLDIEFSTEEHFPSPEDNDDIPF